VLNKNVFDIFEGKDFTDIMWEQEPMHQLVENRQLVSCKHTGFWKCMDILRDKVDLEKMWADNPPWKCW
jgi:glucose-1-phosphate cytidylyltransferase